MSPKLELPPLRARLDKYLVSHRSTTMSDTCDDGMNTIDPHSWWSWLLQCFRLPELSSSTSIKAEKNSEFEELGREGEGERHQ